jgi:hypothetical protein
MVATTTRVGPCNQMYVHPLAKWHAPTCFNMECLLVFARIVGRSAEAGGWRWFVRLELDCRTAVDDVALMV